MDKYEKLINGLQEIFDSNKTKKSNIVGRLMLIDSKIEDKNEELNNTEEELKQARESLNILINFKAKLKKAGFNSILIFALFYTITNLCFQLGNFLGSNISEALNTSASTILNITNSIGQIESSITCLIIAISAGQFLGDYNELRKVKKKYTTEELNSNIERLNKSKNDLELELERLYNGRNECESKIFEIEASNNEIKSVIDKIVENRVAALEQYNTPQQIDTAFRKDADIIKLIRTKQETQNREVNNG